MVDGFQKAALESRLGIPVIYGTDATPFTTTTMSTAPPYFLTTSASEQPEMRIWRVKSGLQRLLKLGRVAFLIISLPMLLYRKIPYGEGAMSVIENILNLIELYQACKVNHPKDNQRPFCS
ncbi:beta-glucosidase [Sarracenia purpurea var. burkii]